MGGRSLGWWGRIALVVAAMLMVVPDLLADLAATAIMAGIWFVQKNYGRLAVATTRKQ